MAKLSRYAQSEIPTKFGSFQAVVYQEGAKEHVALVQGDIRGDDGVVCRIHSECLTGEAFHSLKCDCGDQLDRALEVIAESKRGVLVYLRQEGRGIGLGNKIRAYALQEKGRDTVEANTDLGFGADDRSYDIAGEILADLGVKSVMLLTNNPDKIAGLERSGVKVTRRAHWGTSQEHNAGYLAAKRAKLGHFSD